MRVLYVTEMWDGLLDVAVLGETEPRGMPSFVKALRGLLEAGHEVDLVVATKEPVTLDVGPDWLAGCEFEFVPWETSGLIGRMRSAARVYRAARRRIRSGRYDFVYAHGGVGAIGNLAALIGRVPCGARHYGTWLGPACAAVAARKPVARWVGRMRLRMSNPLETAVYSLPKAFLISTNDGTRSDVVRSVLGRDAYRFHFLRNGRPEPAPPFAGEPLPAGLLGHDGPFILYPARLAPYKRNHLAAELLHQLHVNLPDQRVDLVLAGGVNYPEYADTIVEYARRKGLEDRVHLVGPLPPSRLSALRNHPRCLCVASFYEISNLGNVALEALADGAVLISLAGTSVEDLAVHGESAILVDDVEAGAEELAGLIRNPARAAAIRANAARRLAETVPSWSQRIRAEVEIVEAAVAGAGRGSG